MFRQLGVFVLLIIAIHSHGQQGPSEPNAISCNNWLQLTSQPSYVKVGDLDIPGNQITVEALINRTTPWVGGTEFAGDIVSKHADPANVNYLLRPNEAEITTTNGYFRTPDVCEIELNKTYHIAMVYDGSRLKFYRNGFLLSQIAASGNLFQNDFETRIGYYFLQLYNTNFIGYINEVRIWNVARTQAQIRAYMNNPLPSPTTQPGLLAYYTFDDLTNKQGNATWNGSLVGAASINQTNPTCPAFIPDSCCAVLSGTLAGSNVCTGTQGTLTFTAANGVGPYVLTYSDGTSTYTATGVQSGVAFAVPNNPIGATTYNLVSIKDASSCPATPVSGISAIITVNNCSFCSGSLGDPVVNVTFGSGNNPGPTLPIAAPGASTTLTYIAVTGNPAAPTPVDGQYTITNNSPFNNAWWAGLPDHTPNDVNGYMAFYNASEQPGEFYKQSINNLCPGTTYEFAAWIANCVNPAILNGVNPNITFRIERTDGTLIATYNSGPVTESSVFTWKKYGFYFTLPPAVGSVVLKLINNNPGGTAQQGNDFAIDDITFRPCGPNSTASLSPSSMIDSMQYCEGTALNLYGTVSSGFAAPNYLWQVSSDNGQTWTDLPLSNSLTTSTNIPITGQQKTYEYRMLTGDGVNINSLSCRISSNLLKVVANPSPKGGINGDTICVGSPASLLLNVTLGTSPFTVGYSDGINNFVTSNVQPAVPFTIQSNPLLTTTYQLISLTDKNGCVSNSGFNPSTAIVQVNSMSTQADSIQSNDQNICSGSAVQLNVKGGTLGSAAVWKWYQSSCGGASIGSGTNITVSPSATTTFFVRGEGLCNITSCTKVDLDVLPQPNIVFDSVPDVCADASEFQVMEAKEVSGLQGIESFSGTGINSSGMFSPTNAGNGKHMITYTFITVAGCSDSKSRWIVVNPLPKAEAGADLLVCPNFDAHLNAMGGVSYEWSPTSGLNNSSIPNPIVNITTSTTYSVRVTDAKGCSAIDSVNIIIGANGKESFKMPNAFTPNHDGKNDCFGVRKWGNVTTLEFSIFNRWGQRVFLTTNPNDCWDGTLHGKELDSGGYAYILKANTTCGEISIKGIVMLIR